MSKSTRTFFGVIALIAIVSAWAGVGCMALDKRIPEWPRAQAVLRRVGFACIMIACLTFFNGMGGWVAFDAGIVRMLRGKDPVSPPP